MNIICPHCNRGEMYQYELPRIISSGSDYRLECNECGYWAMTDFDNIQREEFTKSNCYTLEFSTVGGERGKFTGTKEEIHKQIDNYKWTSYDGLQKENKLRMIATNIDILKNGYMNEFKDKEYSKYEFTIDNSFWIRIRYGIF